MRARAWLHEYFPESMVADGFDAAILGVAVQKGRHIVIYDRAKCIRILMKDGMSRDRAEEYFDFNVAGAYVGPLTPLFLEKVPTKLKK